MSKSVKLIIEIPKSDYETICANKEDAIIAHDTCRRIAKNGIPLDTIKTLSVPEREKGEWFAITQPWADTQIFKCTCCGRYIEVPQYEVSTLTIRYPFCHCGAYMGC